MKIYYLNDRKSNAVVYCGTDMAGTPTILKSAEGKDFELDMPDGAQVFIKVWETNVVYISWMGLP